MMAKRVLLQPKADYDARSTRDYIEHNKGLRRAEAFVDDLEQAYEHIGEHPKRGDLRYAADMKRPGLRYWRLEQFPYLVFYDYDKEHPPEHIVVCRVLHCRRDIPSLMRDCG